MTTTAARSNMDARDYPANAALHLLGPAATATESESGNNPAYRYVSKTGSDSNTGTGVGDEWLTVQHALDEATPGTYIRVGPGVYSEQLTLVVDGAANSRSPHSYDADHWITLDGQGCAEIAGVTDDNLVAYNRHYYKIKSLFFTSDGPSWGGASYARPAGVRIGSDTLTASGLGCSHITVEDCSFMEINKTSNTASPALPVLVYSGGDTRAGGTATSYISINNCTIADCDTHDDFNGVNYGYLDIIGNVTDFEVRACKFIGSKYANCVAMDTAGNQTASAWPDQPRRGVFTANYIKDFDNHSVASTNTGIYINAMQNILVERNFAEDNYAVSINVTAEESAFHAAQVATDHIWVRNNVVVGGEFNAVGVGQYSTNYTEVSDVYITHNTLISETGTDPNGVNGAAVLFRADSPGEFGVTGDSAFLNNVVIYEKYAFYSDLDVATSFRLDGNYYSTGYATPFVWGAAIGTVGTDSALPYATGYDDGSVYEALVAPNTAVDADYTPSEGSAILGIGVDQVPPWYVRGMFGFYEPAHELDFLGNRRKKLASTGGSSAGAVDAVSCVVPSALADDTTELVIEEEDCC
jgi:hypothetical protein